MILVQSSDIWKLLVEKHSGILSIQRELKKTKQAGKLQSSNVREIFQWKNVDDAEVAKKMKTKMKKMGKGP